MATESTGTSVANETTAIARREVGGLVLTTIDDMKRFAQAVAIAGYVSGDRGGGEQQAIARAVIAIQAGAEIGLGPFASINGLHVIQGKPVLSATTMATLIKRSGRYDYRIAKQTNTECEIVFYERGAEIGRSSFTAEDAKRAGLSGDNWRKYPANMLFARALSNGCRWHCPDVLGGPTYVDGEIEEQAPPRPAPQAVTVATAVVVPAAESEPEEPTIERDEVIEDPRPEVALASKMMLERLGQLAADEALPADLREQMLRALIAGAEGKLSRGAAGLLINQGKEYWRTPKDGDQ